MADGCLVVYKPKGCTSHDIINKMRRAYKVKCGHAGTLDPMAQGVLLVFCGKALKLLKFLPGENLDKTYLMRVALGVETNTYDAAGEVVYTHDKPINYSESEIANCIKSFVGTFEQVPPAFSAVKVGGRRAYALARAGQEVVLNPRTVHVSSIKFIKDFVCGGTRSLLLRVRCDRGTYVRSIAHDLGQKLGCGAHLSYLLRERVGKWAYTEAFAAYKIEKKLPFEASGAFIKCEDILPFAKLYVTKEGAAKVFKGQPITRSEIERLDAPGETLSEHLQIISPNGTLIAVYGLSPASLNKADSLRLSPLRVFNQNEA